MGVSRVKYPRFYLARGFLTTEIWQEKGLSHGKRNIAENKF
jgi:hypothetical protein